MTLEFALPAAIAVVGLGNLLQRDDGFGPHVIEWLERHAALPDDVELVDVGTAGLHLVTFICGRQAVVFVDALAGAEGEPGEVLVLERDRILAGRPAGPRISPHQPDVREILSLAELAGGAPRDVLLVGVVPEDLSDGIGLSAALEAAVEPAARRVLDELAALAAPGGRLP